MFRLSNLVIFTTSFLVGLSGSLLPGPFLSITIFESTSYGIWAGPMMVVGHAIAELIVVVALVKGLGKFLNQELVTKNVSLVGGIFMLWMSFGMATNAWGPLELGTKATTSGPSSSLILTGVLASVLNPTWLVWWASIGTTYVLSTLKKGRLALTSFYTGHIVSDFSWYFLVSVIVAAGRVLTADLPYRIVLTACGAFLVLLGVYFVFGGLRFWRLRLSTR